MTTAGGNRAGYQSVVEQNQTDNLICSLLVNDEAVTLVSATVSIYGPGGSLLIEDAACSVSENEATYSQSFPEASYARDRGYKAVFSMVYGTTTYSRTIYFAVVRRRFRSQLDDGKLIAEHPGLNGLLSTFQPFITAAWGEIERKLWGKLQVYPGNCFHPETFLDAHVWGTVERFRFSNVLGVDVTEADVWLYEEARRRFNTSFDEASASVDFDADDDGILDADEEGFNFSGIQLSR